MKPEKLSKHDQINAALNTYMHARTPEQHLLIEAAARQWGHALQLQKEASEWMVKS